MESLSDDDDELKWIGQPFLAIAVNGMIVYLLKKKVSKDACINGEKGICGGTLGAA
jgi:hypothetical protein